MRQTGLPKRCCSCASPTRSATGQIKASTPVVPGAAGDCIAVRAHAQQEVLRAQNGPHHCAGGYARRGNRRNYSDSH